MKTFIIKTLLITTIISSLFAREVPTEQKIAGLYVAFFNRAPDILGLNYWKSRADTVQENGQDTSSVFRELSAGFAAHPVFTSTYASLDNEAFVRAVYINALGRAGDEEGINYWKMELDNGLSRSDMVASFIEHSLTLDLTPQNFPTLTTQELDAAKLRQDLITNKTVVSVEFVNQLGDKTNVADSQNPENDPAYVASIKVLSKINEDVAVASGVISYIDNIAGDDDPIREILNQWNGGTLQGDVIIISPQGGEYSTNGLKVNIPANSINSDKVLIVSKERNVNGFDAYKIQGLRKTFKDAIELELPIPPGTDTSKLFVNYNIANGCYATSLDKMIDCNRLLKGSVVNDKYKVIIPATKILQTHSLVKSAISSSELIDNIDELYIKSIQNPDEQTVSLELSSFEYSSDHFLIYAPSMSLYTKVVEEIAPGLEYAYKILSNGLKFDLSKLPNPINVYLVEPGILNGMSGNLGMAVNIPLLDSYIDINVDEVDKIDKKTLWATLGHEFFHIVQRDYSSFNNIFIKEAASVWFENKVDDDSVWKDSSYTANVAYVYRDFPPYGLTTSYVGTKDTVFSVPYFTIDKKADLGYGASTFLDYITGCTSPQIIKSIFENVKAGQSNIDAIDNALRKSDFYCYSTGNTLKDVWNAFLARDYLQTDNVINDSYLADYSLIVKTATDPLEFEKIFTMGPFSGIGILLNGASSNAGSPDYTSVAVNFKGNNIVGQWDNLDGTTYYTFNWKSNSTHILTVSKSGINSKVVVILSNPTKTPSEVDLTLTILSGNSCPAKSPADADANADETYYYKKSDNAYVACIYHNHTYRGETNYLNNKKDGIDKLYDDTSGQPLYEISYKNGLKDGVEKHYTNGSLTGCYIWSQGSYVKSCMP